MANLTKEDIRSVIEIIKELYLEDMIPWICGYSGGKDSTAVVQLVWYALQELPKEKLKKTVHVISTDTLVESPVVAIWATESLKKMEQTAKEQGLPIVQQNPDTWESHLKKLSDIDWRKTNPEWENLVFVNGRVAANRSTQKAMSNYMREVLSETAGNNNG